ncbi:hypothetical protein ACFYO7_15285 [Nocardia salmonicida]|uniref:hypothetical protein n=1 Tax=Nocardia salmonicida TaxID=53431 RepID=UPI0036C6AEA7
MSEVMPLTSGEQPDGNPAEHHENQKLSPEPHPGLRGWRLSPAHKHRSFQDSV